MKKFQKVESKNYKKNMMLFNQMRWLIFQNIFKRGKNQGKKV